MKKPGCMEKIVADTAATIQAPVGENRVLLFTTKTCPNCRIASAMLDNAGIGYEKVDAEEVIELTELYQVRQAPTLVVVSDGQAQTYVGPSGVQTFLS